MGQPWAPRGRGQITSTQMALSSNNATYLPKGVTMKEARDWNKRRKNPNQVTNNVLKIRGKEKEK